MSRHSLTICFEFRPEDRNDPESKNTLDIDRVELDERALESRVENDSQVQALFNQGIMRIHNLKQKANI